ncbi:hypothetical protein F4782DRAFT_521601 [Xylaria castorea]|nr:hypothetical protein F4782DRAFT_521601 [Xylaria castorea]
MAGKEIVNGEMEFDVKTVNYHVESSAPSDASHGNGESLEIIEDCVHRLFEWQALQRPSAPALYAWDVSFTYDQLEQAANRLAHYLTQEVHVTRGSLVHTCFEKTGWYVVAILGINKAGAAWVPLDPSHPSQRKQHIVQQTRATVALTSPANVAACQELGLHAIEVSQAFDTQLATKRAEADRTPPVQVSAVDAAYVLFTSGSTGTPKGIVMEHGAVCTSQRAISKRLKMTPEVRILQFSSFAFDASIGEIIAALITGACVCMPSDSMRMDVSELSAFVRQSQTNWALFTPTFAGLLRPSDFPSLELVALVGEAVSSDTFDLWFGKVPRLLNGWGPTETCVFSALHEWRSAEESPLTIGHFVACRGWIVDPENPQQLMPAGEVGEIMIQGPTLLREYLADPDRTGLVVISTPPSLATPHDSSHWSRCYLTGDLAIQNPDGTLHYCRRKDTQIKIRGLRVELGDIESNLKNKLSNTQQVAVDVISQESGATLVAFISQDRGDSSQRAAGAATEIILFDEETATALRVAADSLETVLPAYMIPTVYLHVRHMPYQLSLKLDRQALRRAAEAISPNELAVVALSRTGQEPPNQESESQLTDEYKRLRGAWAQVLKIDESHLHRASHFLSLGGDSIVAMRLANSLRSSGLDLSAASILKHPELLDMAHQIQSGHKQAAQTVEPFSLVTGDRDLLITHASSSCDIPRDQIHDLYPCTPFQSGIMAIFAREPTCYISTFTYSLRASVDLSMYRAAWEMAHRALPILRTRIILSDTGDYLQVVVNEKISWSHQPLPIPELVDGKAPTAHAMQLGSTLARFCLAQGLNGERHELSLTMHHALYDGWSLTNTISLVEQAYRVRMIPRPVSDFNIYVKFLQDTNEEACSSFWRTALLGSPEPSFPRLPKRSYQVLDDSTCTVATKLPAQGTSASTLATLCQVAWGLLLGKYENTTDVVFGYTLSGRNADLDGINDLCGPTLTTVPLRFDFELEQPVASLLASVKARYDGIMGNEHYGLPNIARLGPDERRGCGFRTTIIIQTPEFETLEAAAADSVAKFQSESPTVYGTPLTVTVRVGRNGDEITARYDSHLLSNVEVTRMLQQYSHLIGALGNAPATNKVSDLDFCSPEDWSQILKLNSVVHERADSFIHDLVTSAARQQPNKRALEAWDGDMTYEELECLSDQLAWRLSQRGVGPEIFVPLCFEKSKWAIVAMLGILKAGGAFVPLDPAHPDTRLSMILEDLDARVAVTSSAHSGRLAFFEDIEVISIDESSFRPLGDPLDPYVRHSNSHNAAYAMFTSGSTGRPKGFVVEHGSYCTGARARAPILGRDGSSRVLQFASYGFDPSIEDIMTTLMFGGCVCIPSTTEMREGIGLYVKQHQVNFANLTPSFAATIDPSEASSLETLVSSGEPMTNEFVSLWGDRVKLMNGYGPSETCIKCAINNNVKPGDNPRNIGFSVAANLWLLDPVNPEKLAPIGAPGELMVEGPCLSRGYLRPGGSANGFIEVPKWLRAIRQNANPRVFRTGDLVCYESDGSISFIGRKDLQVKINGQRTELGEIESQLRRLLPESYTSTVQMISPDGNPNGMLTACIAEKTAIYTSSSGVDAIRIVDLATDHEKAGTMWWGEKRFWPSTLKEQLARVLPVYMMPKAFFALDPIPLNINGKVNRREIASRLSGMRFQEETLESPELDDAEASLLQLWEESIQRKLDRVSAYANFFDLGGDSLAAIRLASLARRKRLQLTAAAIHGNPVLKDMAQLISSSPFAHALSAYQPFSLVSHLGSRTDIVQECSQLCGVAPNSIEDIYPCLPYQEHFIMHAIRFPGQCVFQAVFPLRSDVDLDIFRRAIESIVASHHSLRARLVEIKRTWLQVVVDQPVEWLMTGSLSSVWDAHASPTMMAGDELNRFALVIDEKTGLSSFVWTSNHAIFDGWSVSTFLYQVDWVYSTGKIPDPQGNYSELVRHTLASDAAESRAFWTEYFQDIDCKPLCEALEDPLVDFHWHREFRPPPFKIAVSLPTAILAAWGLVIGHQTKSNDAVVSLLQLGRDSPVDGIENVIGLVATAFPFRIKLDTSAEVKDFLLDTNDRLNRARRFQYAHPDFIRECSADANRGMDSQTRYVAHPAQFRDDSSSSPEPVISDRSHRVPVKGECIEISLSFTCGGPDNVVAMDLTYDSRSFDQVVIQSLMEHFELVLVQLLQAPSGQRLKDLSWEVPAALRAHEITKTPLSRAADWAPYTLSHKT